MTSLTRMVPVSPRFRHHLRINGPGARIHTHFRPPRAFERRRLRHQAHGAFRTLAQRHRPPTSPPTRDDDRPPPSRQAPRSAIAGMQYFKQKHAFDVHLLHAPEVFGVSITIGFIKDAGVVHGISGCEGFLGGTAAIHCSSLVRHASRKRRCSGGRCHRRHHRQLSRLSPPTPSPPPRDPRA